MEQRSPGSTVAYWSLAAALFTAQAVFSLSSRGQIRYEELAESVRNVLWLGHRLLYDPVSSNIGWYGLLLGCYRAFGFSLNEAKWIRLALSAFSLSAVGSLLERRLTPRRAWLPLLAWGLSPTFLFFNTLQTSYGIDAQIFPPLLWLLLHRDASGATARLNEALVWFLAMVAWLSFPTFGFLLPALALMQLWRLRGLEPRTMLASAVGALVGFLLPFLLALSWLTTPDRLLAGAFRGGGAADPSVRGLLEDVEDLTVRGTSYHFEVVWPDLSGLLPVVSALVVVALAVAGARARRDRQLILIGCLMSLGLALVAALISGGPPGARRITPALLALYALVALAWEQADELPAGSLRWGARIACLCLPLHHLLVLPVNYNHLRDPSPWRDPWFSSGPSPTAVLESYVRGAQGDGLLLSCSAVPGAQEQCRYAEVFAAVAGACRWNHLTCRPVLAADPAGGGTIPLSVGMWESGRLEH